jgi:FkbM family methyltransferase
MNDPQPYGAHTPVGLSRWVIERTRSLSDGWAARRLLHAMRRIAIRTLNGAPADVEVLGVRMRLYPYNNICEKRVLFTPQLFDPAELEILSSRIRDGFTFVDVGANIGVYSLYVAAIAGPTARILAIEPQPDIFDRLTYNIGLNPFGTIKAIACALADKAGELTLFVDPRNRGESSVKIVGSGQAPAVKVPAITLLELLGQENFRVVDAIKLDVEGAEDLILDPFFRDAPESLFPSLLIIEDGRSQWQTDLPALLEKRGYRLLKQTRLNLVYERQAS